MSILAAVLVITAVPADLVAHGSQFDYRGRLVADKGDAADAPKDFQLTALVAKTEGGSVVYWTSEEQGRGGWPWHDRFGKLRVNGKMRPEGGVTPTLLLERAEGNAVVPLALPFLAYDEPLSEGVMWIENRQEHRVVGSEAVKIAHGAAKGESHDTWRVEVFGPIGRQRVLWVDKAAPVVLALEELVFIGQGERHVIRYELESRRVLESEAATQAVTAFEEFERLRSRLGLASQSQEPSWNAARLAMLNADLPDVTKKSENTLLAKLLQSAQRDAKTQKDRVNAVGALEGKRVGHEAPQPVLKNMAGENFDWQDIQGKVAILHFWEYRDTPLEEPYGQVAYLDYLLRKGGLTDLRIYGIVADERVFDSETRPAGIQSARRLHSFMNLSYPLLVDGGDAIKKFGDPRATGARLPLFVVVDRTGKVVHYHVGHYEVSRDRGLEELEAVIKKALENRG